MFSVPLGIYLRVEIQSSGWVYKELPNVFQRGFDEGAWGGLRAEHRRTAPPTQVGSVWCSSDTRGCPRTQEGFQVLAVVMWETEANETSNPLTAYGSLTSPWNRHSDLPRGAQLPPWWHFVGNRRESQLHITPPQRPCKSPSFISTAPGHMLASCSRLRAPDIHPRGLRTEVSLNGNKWRFPGHSDPLKVLETLLPKFLRDLLYPRPLPSWGYVMSYLSRPQCSSCCPQVLSLCFNKPPLCTKDVFKNSFQAVGSRPHPSPQNFIRFTIWHSRQWRGFQFCPYPPQHQLLSPVLFCSSHPSGCEAASHRGQVCISPRPGDLERLFMYLLPICTHSLEKCLFKSSSAGWLVSCSVVRWLLHIFCD